MKFINYLNSFRPNRLVQKEISPEIPRGDKKPYAETLTIFSPKKSSKLSEKPSKPPKPPAKPPEKTKPKKKEIPEAVKKVTKKIKDRLRKAVGKPTEAMVEEIENTLKSKRAKLKEFVEGRLEYGSKGRTWLAWNAEFCRDVLGESPDRQKQRKYIKALQALIFGKFEKQSDNPFTSTDGKLGPYTISALGNFLGLKKISAATFKSNEKAKSYAAALASLKKKKRKEKISKPEEAAKEEGGMITKAIEAATGRKTHEEVLAEDLAFEFPRGSNEYYNAYQDILINTDSGQGSSAKFAETLAKCLEWEKPDNPNNLDSWKKMFNRLSQHLATINITKEEFSLVYPFSLRYFNQKDYLAMKAERKKEKLARKGEEKEEERKAILESIPKVAYEKPKAPKTATIMAEIDKNYDEYHKAISELEEKDTENRILAYAKNSKIQNVYRRYRTAKKALDTKKTKTKTRRALGGPDATKAEKEIAKLETQKNKAFKAITTIVNESKDKSKNNLRRWLKNNDLPSETNLLNAVVEKYTLNSKVPKKIGREKALDVSKTPGRGKVYGSYLALFNDRNKSNFIAVAENITYQKPEQLPEKMLNMVNAAILMRNIDEYIEHRKEDFLDIA